MGTLTIYRCDCGHKHLDHENSNGHEFDDANTYRLGRRRSCRACNRSAAARYAARRAGQGSAS